MCNQALYVLSLVVQFVRLTSATVGFYRARLGRIIVRNIAELSPPALLVWRFHA